MKNRIVVLLVLCFFIVGCEKGENKMKKDNTISNKKTDTVSVVREKAPSNSVEFSKLSDGEYETEKGFILKIVNGIAYIDNHIIVNKTYNVPNSYIPDNPYEEVKTDKCNNCINKDVMEAFNRMKSDALALGLNIYISSGYRSYNYQNNLYNRYVSISGKDGADTYSARPGYSEHQTGTCFDLNSIDDSFQYTNEGKWIDKNAYLYGFIIRYPKGKESITGYQYESWHLRYIGEDISKKLYNNGDWITLEEYFGISSSYE